MPFIHVCIISTLSSFLTVHPDPPFQRREHLVVVAFQKADLPQVGIHLLQETCGLLEMSMLLSGLGHSRDHLESLNTSDMSEGWLC